MLSFYGTPCPKLNGKALASPGREPGSFAVMCKPDEKEILLETDPDTFWQTPHYAGWHALLVRYGSDDPERVADVLRSEERRVGNEWLSTCRSRWSPSH